MARPKEFQVEEVLDRAIDAFWEHGYLGTSINDITIRTGVQKPSLYLTFGDKRALFLQALHKYQVDDAERMRAHFEKPGPVFPLIEEFLMSPLVEKVDGRGCLCVNVQVELGAHDPEIREVLVHHFEQVRAMLVSTLERGSSLGELKSDLDCAAAADLMLTVMCGAYVKAPHGRCPERARAMLKLALEGLT